MAGRWITAGIHGALTGLSHLGRRHPKAREWCHGVQVVKDVPYRREGHPAHTLDIYRPSTPPPWPVLVYVHGGGFGILSKDTHWMFGYGFAQRGFLVFNVGYRLAPQFPFPAAIEDVSEALLFVLDRARAEGGNPDTLVYAGESAGANLILGLTIAGAWPRPEPHAQKIYDRNPNPRVVLPACGLLQVSDSERYTTNHEIPAWIRARLKRACQSYLPHPEAVPDLAFADPLCFLETAEEPDRPLPAVFAGCGGRDPVLNDTVRLEKALGRYPVESSVRIYERGHHAFHAVFWSEEAKRLWSEQDTFLFPKVGLHAK